MQTLETTRTTEEELQPTQPQELLEQLVEESLRAAINSRAIAYSDRYTDEFTVEVCMGRDYSYTDHLEVLTVYVRSVDWNNELDHVSMAVACGEAA